MRIQRLQIENFLRVKSITIVPVGNVVRLHGRNKAGKTSVLRAIQAALGGAKMKPKKPIRDGEEEASVRIDLGEYTVEVLFRPEGRVDLTLRTADGATVRSPATTLAGFVGSISFDALAFMRLEPAAQVELLRKLAGVDFTALEQERAALYAKRTDVGRDRDKAVAQGAGAPAGEPPAEVSLATLTAQIQAVSDAETDAKIAAEKAAQRARSIKALATDLEGLRAHIAAAEKNLSEELERATAAAEEAAAAAARLKAMGDATAVRERLKTAEADNARARDLAAKRAKKLEGDALAKQYEAITKSIDGIDAKKRKMVAAATLPVEGLDFTGAEVTFGGRPLSQASDREQVLISAAIGHSLNPKLAALLIREGAFLDEDGWQALGAWAEERDVQVWIEDVGTGGAGVLIEDGMVVEGDPATVVRELAGKPLRVGEKFDGLSSREIPASSPLTIAEEAALNHDNERNAAEAMLLADDDAEDSA